MKTLSEGLYTTIQQDEYNRLIITATKEARDLQEAWNSTKHRAVTEDSRKYMLMCEHYSDGWLHGWISVKSLEIGAGLGEKCLIITDRHEYDVWGNKIILGGLWYHERYAVELFSEQVFAGGVMMLPVPVQEEVTE